MEAVVVEAAVSKVMDEMVDSVWRQMGYVWNYNVNMKGLKAKVEMLIAEKRSVLHQVEEATNKGEEIEDTVKIWLARADEAIAAADIILKEVNVRPHSSCFTGCNPNWKTRYMLSRKARKETLPVVDGVRGDKNFDRISYRIPVQKLEVAKDFEAFESRTQVVNEILEALRDPDIKLIGVYGLPGVGKTTLIKQIVAQVKENGMDKVVARATVTNTPDVNKIQQEIADWLGFTFDIESTEVRATRLRARLKQEETFLVILDDIWDKVKLEEIGIPHDHQGCNVFVTSRDLSVLLEMGVQRYHLLEVLQEEEAWKLFEKKAADVKYSSLMPIAAEVARRCGGLPVLIVAIATALKNKDLCEWEDALEELKRFDNEGLEGFQKLELSYRYLGADEKLLFVLCGQLVSHSIPVSGLLLFSMGMGLSRRFTTVHAARNRIFKVVNDLKRSCLLIEGNNNDEVKMHDVVHRFAAFVATRDHHIFTVAYDSILEEWPTKDELEQFTAISLPYCKRIPNLPEVFDCPKLQSFLLGNRTPSLEIPDQSFSMMKNLKLFVLTHVLISPIPSSIQFLESIHTLCLYSCTLEDVVVIGKLKTLHVLSFNGSSITQLPKELGELISLQILDLSNCKNLVVIPPGIISCLTKLEELYIGNSFVKWEGEQHDGIRINASLAELKLLPRLCTLELHILSGRHLQNDLFSEKLERFVILIGEEWDWPVKYETSRTLKFKLNSSIELETVKLLLRRSEDLYLGDLKGEKSVVYDLDEQGFPELKHLHIQNNHEIQHLLGRMRMGGQFIAFPKLESLLVDNLNNLEKICYGQLKVGSFKMLRKLKVGNCKLLKTLFPLSVFREFLQIEEIYVNGCEIMEEIASKGDGTGGENEVVTLIPLQSLTLEYLPKLKGFYSRSQVKELPSASTSSTEVKSKIEESETSGLLFGDKVHLPSLSTLKLSSISMKKIWLDKLGESHPSIQNLTSLIVEGCGNLRYLFSSPVILSLVQLKKLEISDCNSLAEIIVAEESGEMSSNILFPKLESLKLLRLPIFSSFCTSNLLECPSLKVLWLDNCPLLQSFISTPISSDGQVNKRTEQGRPTLFDDKVSFPNLEELCISYMHKLQGIWNNDLRADSFCKLNVLKIEHVDALLNIFSYEMLGRFLYAKELVVKNCDSLEVIFDIQCLLNARERANIAAAACQLRTLMVQELPKLKHIWNADPDGILSFYEINYVGVWVCPILESFFPFSIAQSLPQLELFNVNACGLKELVVKEKMNQQIESSPKFSFPRLKYLKLHTLKELKCFYSSEHYLDCPSLEELNVCGCEKLQTFISERQDMEGFDMEKQQQLPSAQPLFSFRKIIGKLVELGLDCKDIMMQCPEELCHKLEVLHLRWSDDDASKNIPFHVLQKFKNLEKLVFRRGHLKELLPHYINVLDDGPLKRIKWLSLQDLPEMKYLWNEDCQPLTGGQGLQNLQTLEIWYCDGLINLVPYSASFQNLTTLQVWRCDALLNLFSSFTAKSLVNLTNIMARECKTMKEIIANEGAESQVQSQSSEVIIFEKLQSLTLYSLMGLNSFCSSSNCIVKFPSLEVVIVSLCPKMKYFSQGVISAPKLKRVLLTLETDKWRWIGDLDTTIKYLYNEMMGFSGRRYIRLSDFPQLQDVWHAQLPVNIFYNLVWLEIDECAFSTSSVPSKLLPFLNNLEFLEVRSCNGLKQVFDSNDSGDVAYLPKLNKLHLIGLPSLRLLWNENPKWNFDLKNLTVLAVHNCPSLTHILTPAVCSSLVQIGELTVKNCDMVKEIITEGFEKEDVIFPFLKSITLESLPSLIKFTSGSGIVQCPLLIDVTVIDCPASFADVFLGETEPDAIHGIIVPKLSFPSMKHLKLLSVNIEKLWHARKLEPTSIKNLKNLTLNGCGNIKYALSSSIIKSVAHLRRIEICNCKMMEEVIATEKGLEAEKLSDLLLTELDFLKLKDLPRLARFCASNSIECPGLKQLHIDNCPELRTFITSSSSSNMSGTAFFHNKVSFPNLEELQIFNMSRLKVIWNNEHDKHSFFSLKTLVVQQAKALQSVFPGNLVTRFPSLECLCIQGSDSLEEVFDLQGLGKGKEKQEAVTQLKTLKVHNLPSLKYVWNENPQGIMESQNLRSVDVSDCSSLKYLFPVSVAKSLLRLEELKIIACGIEAIVAEPEIQLEASVEFEFPHLMSLVLRGMPQLKRFFPAMHSIHWPVLRKLRVSKCEGIEIFSSEVQDSREQLVIQTGLPLLSLNKIVPNLEELAISSQDVARIYKADLTIDLFNKVKVLELNTFNDTSAVFQLDLLQRFPNLRKLVFLKCDFEELFPREQLVDNEKHQKVLAKVQSLQLDMLPNLKNIWHQHSQLDHVLQNLDSLKVLNCDSLINLAPPFASLKNLSKLEVVNCKRLVSLMASATAKSLVHLRVLSIKECDMLREVFSTDGDDTIDEIIFSQLESMELHCLPSLTSFCSGKVNFQFVRLFEVICSQCPKLEVFSDGAVKTFLLQNVLLTREKDKVRWDGNLDTTINQLFLKNGQETYNI